MDNPKRLQIDNLNFSPYDVRANREGYLTKEQRVYLAEERKTAHHWTFIASFIFGGFALVLINSPYNLTTGVVAAIVIAVGFGRTTPAGKI